MFNIFTGLRIVCKNKYALSRINVIFFRCAFVVAFRFGKDMPLPSQLRGFVSTICRCYVAYLIHRSTRRSGDTQLKGREND